MPPSTATGQLADGTPYHGRLGQIANDSVEDKVQCHLCGQWLRAVSGSHLTRRHGWTMADYRAAFGLTKRQPPQAAGTLAKHRATTIERLKADEIRLPNIAHAGANWRSLAELRPDLSAQWHPSRNGDLNPVSVAPWTHQRVWWQCSACAHEWQAAVRDRSSDHGCPACALAGTAARATGARDASLTDVRPELAAQLHPTRNGDLGPATLGPGARRRVWWLCPDCGHEWQASPHNRSHSQGGCPACTQAAAQRRFTGPVPYERSLAARRPDLLTEWHPTRNGDLDPSTLAASSHRKVWWRCPTCGREWQSSPNARRRRPANGCKPCANRASALLAQARPTRKKRREQRPHPADRRVKPTKRTPTLCSHGPTVPRPLAT